MYATVVCQEDARDSVTVAKTEDNHVQLDFNAKGVSHGHVVVDAFELRKAIAFVAPARGDDS